MVILAKMGINNGQEEGDEENVKSAVSVMTLI